MLTLALIVAAYHLGSLVSHSTHSITIGHRVLIAIAIVLPALGAAFVGLQSVLGSQRLSPSYVYHAQALERLEKRLVRLQADLNQATVPPADLQFHFRRAVLETEELLSNELHLWWLIMYPKAPKASP